MPARVYYEDTDAAGVVYYASYLKFFERCRTEWLRTTGCAQTDLMTEHGYAFVVRRVTLEYLAPGRLDDLLTITLSIESMGRAQIVFRQRACRDDQCLAEGTVQVVCVDMKRMKSAPIPTWLRERLVAAQTKGERERVCP
ncbi:MAG: tol-pal system-associated acyl-CoA thioesterase [Zoogloeaceae bacterium]|nr:tol-pal system-associated acyl-CoA thioesterase [Zoogloeaceae bacterium]